MNKEMVIENRIESGIESEIKNASVAAISKNLDKNTIVQKILQQSKKNLPSASDKGMGYAPSNIALCKYWGKRNEELNLPTTPSLSISLGNFGARTTISVIEKNQGRDIIFLNGKILEPESAFAKRLSDFLDLFRSEDSIQKTYFKVETEINIPVGAGLASSACGFAAIVKAFDNLYGWQLEDRNLSLLARLGSGSACRSLWHGFVEWQMGLQLDGMDSVGTKLPEKWPELRVGLLMVNAEQKKISSRTAMKRCVLTSPYYAEWPKKHALDFLRLKNAIFDQNFIELGETAESNALAMHALMMTAWPPFLYTETSTIGYMQRIWQLRQQGLALYFTQDAGPNLKLLFLEQDSLAVQQAFPGLLIIAPFLEEDNQREG
jgi:diphosphomevalonate decarboxylase